MPTIAEAVVQTSSRRQAGGGNTSVSFATPPPNVAPTPPQDLPVGQGLPQRGMFSSNLVLDSDRSDSSRVFRGSGMRSPVFQPQTPAQVTNNKTTVETTTITPTPTPIPTPNVPSGLANQVYATPDGSAGPASLRYLVYADFPNSGVTPGSYTNADITVNEEGIITAASNGAASSLNLVQATVDFGSDSGSIVRAFDASVTVSATWVTADSIILVTMAGIATTNHGVDDALFEGLIPIVDNLNPGVGFTIRVYSPLGSWGKYVVNAVGM